MREFLRASRGSIFISLGEKVPEGGHNSSREGLWLRAGNRAVPATLHPGV